MPEPTKAKADDTPDEAANNTDKAKAEGADSQAAKSDDAPKFTQEDLNRIAAKARKEEREKAAKEAEEAEAKRKEEEATKQGEFQKLYAKLKPEHEAQGERLKRYEETVKTMAESELDALPAEVKDMAPDLSDPLAVLAWLPKGKALAAKLEGQPAAPGAKADPKPKAPAGAQQADEAAKSSQRSMYRTF